MADDPINAGDIEWISFRYRELEENELFWMIRDKNSSNNSYRKIDDFSALHLVEQKVVSVEPTKLVYQKEY